MPHALEAAREVRWLSIFFGAGTLICIYLTGLLAFGGSAWKWAAGGRVPAILATVYAGLLPEFSFLSGAINNDNAVIFFCALSLLVCLWISTRQKAPPWWQVALAGGVIGLGMLAKYNEIVFIPLFGLALAVLAFRLKSFKVFWQGTLAGAGACIAVSGWWFVRSTILYGDPAGWGMWRSSFKSAYSEDFKWTRAALSHFWSRWFDSWWGVFGWFNVRLEPEVYCALGWVSAGLALCIAGLVLWMIAGAGWLKWGKKGRDFLKGGLPGDYRTWQFLLFSSLTVILVGISALNYAASFGDAGTQGRYLFPALPAVALLVGAGLGWVIGGLRFLRVKWLPGAAGYGVLAVGVLLLSVFNQHALYDRLSVAYATPDVIVKSIPDSAVRVQPSMTFWPSMGLAGYEIPHKRAYLKPGPFKLSLYWQAQRRTEDNFILFVKVMNGKQEVTGVDGPPGDGRFQTFKWMKASFIRDDRTLNFTPPMVAQLQSTSNPVRFMLGWYKSPGGERAKMENTKAQEIFLDWT